MEQQLIPEGSRDFIDVITGTTYDRTGFDLEDVQGIGPSDASINYTEFAMIPGAQYHSFNTQARNIVLKIGLTDNYDTGKTVQDLRRELYKVVVPGNNIRVRLYNNASFEMQIDGWVETVEPVIFSKDPEVQISIICTHPFFREPGSSVIENLHWSHSFYYEGDIVRGYNIVVTILRDINWLEVQDLGEIYDAENRPSIRINHPIDAGDKVRIITTPGLKQVTLMDSNEEFKARLITFVEVGPGGWPQMKPGDNVVGVRGSQSESTRYNMGMVRRYGGF